MSILAVHAAALASRVASYHEFLARYSKTKKVVYGFVEGKGDHCFYQGFIEQEVPEDWDVELWSAGNKAHVYGIHADMDWRRFAKKRICFFVDRDLSTVVPEKLVEDSNIYVTDSYSIENDMAKKATCRRVLKEVFGFTNADHAELDQACELFAQELERFQLQLVPIMAWILAWRRSRRTANLNDILMKDLFSVVDGVLQATSKPKGKSGAVEYIHSQCNLPIDSAVDIAAHQSEFQKDFLYRKFSRGKYVLWFLVEFCRSVHASASSLFKAYAKSPPMNVSIFASNATTIIGQRARMPASLKAFLQSTYCEYIAKNASKHVCQ